MMIILYLLFAVIVFFIIYSLIPTVLMRGLSLGLFNRSHVQGKVALTFDDGPNPIYTPKLLDMLQRFNVKATFFVVGVFAEEHPDILQRMDREGHEVGIHHYKHTSNWLLTPFASHMECIKTEAVIEGIIGKRPMFYRPPWGHLNLFSWWSRRPFILVLWTAILGDWNRKVGKQRLELRIRKSVRDGAIIVLHDNDQTPGADDGAPEIMLQALEDVLKDVHDKYQFVTVHELYNES